MNAMPQKLGKNPMRFLLYVPVPWMYVLIYLVGIGVERAVRPHGAGETNPAVSVAGAALFAIGAVIAGWGWMTFHRARTTTIPGKASSKLVTWGPYRFTRNPMYVGLLIAYLGEAGLLRQFWPAVLLPLVVVYVNWIVIPVEEAKLEEVFGEDYQRYRARVRRWI